MQIAVLGLGEAGKLYASGLAAAGAEVSGYDPFARIADPAVIQHTELSDALKGAQLVLSLTGARASVSVAKDALPLVPRDAIYADLNTGSIDTKTEIARLAARSGVPVADVAVLAPVPRSGHRSPLAASGTGASAFARHFRVFGADVTVVGSEAGDAARLKLLRSVFMKGLAALVIEGLTAAESIGASAWLREQISAELEAADGALVERLISGTHAHAERRAHEVRDALEALEAGDQPSDMTRATLAWFTRILDDADPDPAR